MTVWQFATAHCVWCKNTEKFGKILNDSDKTNVICLRQRTDCLTLESELPIYNSNRILGRNLRMKFVIYILCAGVSWCPPHVSGQDQTGHRLAGRHGAGLACLPAWLLLLSLPLCTPSCPVTYYTNTHCWPIWQYWCVCYTGIPIIFLLLTQTRPKGLKMRQNNRPSMNLLSAYFFPSSFYQI